MSCGALVHVHSWTDQHLREENFWGTQKREGGVIWSAAAKYTILPSVPAHLDHLRCLFTQVPLCLGGGSQNFGHIDIYSGTKHNTLHSLTLQYLNNPRIDKIMIHNHFYTTYSTLWYESRNCHSFCICFMFQRDSCTENILLHLRTLTWICVAYCFPS